MRFKAVIFDQDGTVADHELIYEKAFKIVLARYGVNPSHEFCHERGIGIVENWENFFRRFDLQTDKTPSDLAQETQDEFERMIDQSRLTPGFREFAIKLKKGGIKLALATSNSRGIVYKIGKLLEIDNLFDAIVTGEDVENKKPDPEIFLLCARKLKVHPFECFVFEDASSGVIAAKKAGMKVGVILHNNFDHPVFDRADLVVEDFSSVPVGLFI